jgi:hypothetical protein
MSKTSPTYLSYKDYAYLDKNGVPPAHGIPLIFASKASPQYALNALNINSGYARDNNNIILWPLYTGASSWNTVWYITPEGYIVCPSFPWIVLGIVNGILCVVTRNSSDATQLWSLTGYGDGYTITNNNSQQVITAATQSVYENGAQQAGSISMESLNGGSPDASQLWIPLPAGNIPQSRFYIQTKMSGLPGTGNNPNVVTMRNNQAYVTDWVPGNTSQLWIMRPDGIIALASDPSAFLSPTAQTIEIIHRLL